MELSLEIQKTDAGISISYEKAQIDFFSTNLPKNSLELEIQETNVRIRINILEIPCEPIFRQNGQLWIFQLKFAQK